MKKFFNNHGSALLVTILLISVVFFLGLYFLSFAMTEKMISEGQTSGLETYHLAEAGIEEMIWRLKNDEVYKNNFETDPDWTASFTQNSPFGGSGAYEVTITNSRLAQGTIEAVGIITDSRGNTSQRIVRTSVYKATASSTELGDHAIFGDGNINFLLSRVNFPDSSLHSNHVIEIKGIGTEINIGHDLKAVHKISKSFWSTVNVGGEMRDNFDYSPAPEEVEMPPVSFYEEDDSQSFKNRADVVYSSNQFRKLLRDADGGSLVLNDDITYVEGNVIVGQDIDLTINGLLVVDGNMEFGAPCSTLSCCGNYTNLTVNYATSSPSGLIANGNIKFQYCLSSADISGVIYATKNIGIIDFSGQIDINGGIYAKVVEIFSVWQPISIRFNSSIVQDSLQITEFSPVVTVEHWEEEY